MAEETTNQGNIKIEYNTATTGMNMDNSVNQVPKGMLTYALNAAVENFDSNSVNYQNEPGNELCLEFPMGYQLIGTHFINEKNKHIFFLANSDTSESQIGYMENNDCIYRPLIDAPCLNFNIHYPIHKIVHKITNCTTEIYWTDGFNPRRWLDIDMIPYILRPGSELCDPTPTTEVDCNQLKLQPNFEIPQLNVTDVTTGGALIAGTYQFAIQYSDASGNPYTSYYSITNPTPIANTQLTTPNFNYEVGKSIVLNVTNLDATGQFQYFNIAVIKTINDITSVELVGTYFIDKIERNITYTGQNQTQIRLTTSDIYEKYPYYDIAQDLTTVQDVLVWDNLTSIDRINYQSIASQITLGWQTYRIPNTEDYSDEINATNFRGYLRDEVYAFEIVFLLRNGKQTDGFHIPGRIRNNNENIPDVADTNPDFIGEPDYEVGGIGYSPYWKIYNTASVTGYAPEYTGGTDYKGAYQYGDFAYWESTELYPCNTDVWGDLSDTPIRHHKFPDVLVSPIYESPTYSVSGPITPVMQNDAIFPIGVMVDLGQIRQLINISSLTSDQKNDIVAFKIVRGNRGTNKSIVAKGILRNVGKYTREQTDYYYPNYPYNDIKKDPFILATSNSYSLDCTSYMITPSADGTINYVDCDTNQAVAQPFLLVDGVFYLCSIDLPIPTLNTTATVSIADYSVWRICNIYSAFNPTFSINLVFSYITPFRTGPTDNGFRTIVLPPDTCTGSPALPDVASTTKPIQVTFPTQGGISTITELNKVRGPINCGLDEDYLYGFESDDQKYRHVFNSPETSFGQPFLGGVLKLENVMFGAGSAHFVQVKNHALYKLLTKEAQQDALDSSAALGAITGTGTSFSASAMFTAYQAYLAIYINGITRRNYTYSFNSIASYDYSADIQNNIGVKQRTVDIAQYIIPGVQSIGDNHNINNWNRESSVYIKTTDKVDDFLIPYDTYQICNNNILVPSLFNITNPTTGQQNVLVTPGVCNSYDSTTYPIFVSGSINYSITITSSGFAPVTGPTPSLPYPSETPSLIFAGSSVISDNSRFIISEKGNCVNPGKEEDITVVSYYGSLKNIFVNQWGQMYSYETIDTGFQRSIDPVVGSTIDTVFGGDTFITRFAFKTKLPFFIDNRVNAPDDSDIFYDEIGNVAYPRYWFSSRSNLDDYYVSQSSTNLLNIISYKAHRFDCPNTQNLVSGSFNRTFYDGKMYLFAYGVPNFYCESSYNVNLRQAFNNKEGDFWPHVSTSIPDDWVQESFVTIQQDNTYYYNVTFSKQNKEDYFSHLPPDWKAQLCFTNYPFRAIYSDSQDSNPNNKVNAWLNYGAASYFDFPQNFGKLTSLDGIQNRAVLARFENKSLLYNTLLTVDTSNPQAAYLGNSTLFKSSPPIDFAETDLGYVGSQHKFLLKIPQGQITADAKRGQVFLIAGNQATDLSAFGSGMNRFFTDHLAFEILRYFPNVDVDNHFNGIGLHGVYDSKYDRVIITKLDYIPVDDRIKYDPETKEFYIEEELPFFPASSTTTTSSSSTSTTTSSTSSTSSTTSTSTSTSTTTSTTTAGPVYTFSYTAETYECTAPLGCSSPTGTVVVTTADPFTLPIGSYFRIQGFIDTIAYKVISGTSGPAGYIMIPFAHATCVDACSELPPP